MTPVGRQSRAQVMVPGAQLACPAVFYRSGNVLWVVDVAAGLLIPAVILLSGFSSRIRSVAVRIGRRWLPAVLSMPSSLW